LEAQRTADLRRTVESGVLHLSKVGVDQLLEHGDKSELNNWKWRKNMHRERCFIKGFLPEPKGTGEQELHPMSLERRSCVTVLCGTIAN